MIKVVEILQYRLKAGTGRAFFDLMRDVSVPLHRDHGIDVVWHGPSLHDPDCYGLIRAFADLETLDSALATFYAGADWRSGPREAILACIDVATKIVVPMTSEAIEGLRETAALPEAG